MEPGYSDHSDQRHDNRDGIHRLRQCAAPRTGSCRAPCLGFMTAVRTRKDAVVLIMWLLLLKMKKKKKKNTALLHRTEQAILQRTALLHRTEQAILQRTKKRGVFHAPSRLSEAGHNPLTKRANSTTLNAQRTGTGLGWDPDMRCNVPTTTLPGPHPTVRKRNSAAQEQNVKKKKCIIYILRSRHI